MREYTITCPFCFAEFSHKAVHFRMETYFDENNLNDQGYTVDELLKMPQTAEVKKMLAQSRNRSYFIYKDDPVYQQFWKKYGTTTEVPDIADRDLQCEVYQLPVLNPNNPTDQYALKEIHHDAQGADKYLELDGDGMVAAVTDIFGNRTIRRVCPKCHNPLPLQYGKNPVKFISVIGVTSSGKTVYISQLLRHISNYSADVSMVANIMSSHESNFIDNNRVEMGTPLPAATISGQLNQPMFYDLLQQDDKGRRLKNSVVIFDIAGESFNEAGYLLKYGDFVTKSDGIIFLVDPKQLMLVAGQMEQDTEPIKVLQTIHQAFVGNRMDRKCPIPVAVCVSKSDIFAPGRIEAACRDTTPVIDNETGDSLPLFNATDYNQLEPEIKSLMNKAFDKQMDIEYERYNYFAFSATGCAVEKREEDGRSRYYLTAPASPKRIAEPLMWLFHQFGYIKSDVPVRLPHRRREHKVFVGYSKLSPLDVILGKSPQEIWRDMTPEEKKTLDYEPASMAARPL